MAADKVIKPWPLYYKLIQVVLYTYYRICFDFKFYGIENVPEDARGIIFAPNHASYLDPPIVGISLKKPINYLAKEYLFKVFALGRTLYWLGALPIKSESDDFRSMRQLLRALKEGKHLVIFPEGTRSEDGRFREVEGGAGFLAVKSKAYVVPVYIQGSFDAFPKGVKWFRCKPVRAYFGKPFIPCEDAGLMAEPDRYLAVGRKIMLEIQKVKADAESGLYPQRSRSIFVRPGTK